MRLIITPIILLTYFCTSVESGAVPLWSRAAKCIRGLLGEEAPPVSAVHRTGDLRTLRIIDNLRSADKVPRSLLQSQTPLWTLAAQPNPPDEEFYDSDLIVGRILNPSPNGAVRDELEFLLNELPRPNQLRMALHWENFCAGMAEAHGTTWKTTRFFGTDGSYGYFGDKGFGVVFTPTHEIFYTGRIDLTSIGSDNTWIPNLDGWTKQKKDFKNR